MNGQVFFWYVLPLIIGGVGCAWLAYDRRRQMR